MWEVLLLKVRGDSQNVGRGGPFKYPLMAESQGLARKLLMALNITKKIAYVRFCLSIVS